MLTILEKLLLMLLEKIRKRLLRDVREGAINSRIRIDEDLNLD